MAEEAEVPRLHKLLAEVSTDSITARPNAYRNTASHARKFPARLKVADVINQVIAGYDKASNITMNQ